MNLVFAGCGMDVDGADSSRFEFGNVCCADT
jgi:hypothetical protein